MTGNAGPAIDVNPVLVEVERSGFVESRHRGAAIGLRADGSVGVRAGDIDRPIFPRSANKPFQAVAMLRSGLELEGNLLALASASHSGEDFHVEGVEKILATAGLTADALQCPAQWPLDTTVALDLARRGGTRSALRMNCSGKHAAMLAACVLNGWPLGSYLDVGHPMQAAVREVITELTGERPAAVGVDGCGAPLFAVSLHALARGLRALVLAAPGSPERGLRDALLAHPAWLSGTDRAERRLMDAVPGLVVKCGAEGVDAFVLTDGRAGAVKVDDGAGRARTVVTVALLRALHARERAGGRPPSTFDELAAVPLYGGGEVVGSVRLSSGSLSPDDSP